MTKFLQAWPWINSLLLQHGSNTPFIRLHLQRLFWDLVVFSTKLRHANTMVPSFCQDKILGVEACWWEFLTSTVQPQRPYSSADLKIFALFPFGRV